MNSLKYKKKEETSIFHSIDSPDKLRYEKFNFINSNQPKNKFQPMKLQRSYRQSRIVIKRQRYDSIQNVVEKNQKIRSLSLRKSQQNSTKNLQKSIRLFKRSSDKKQGSLNLSIEKARQSVSPYTNQSKKLLLNKKLTIIDRDSNIRNRMGQSENKSQGKSKFRIVKSNFSKADSLQFSDTIIEQSSEQIKKTNNKINAIDIIKKLVKNQQYKKALLSIKKQFSQNNEKQNVELLLLFATCMYNLEQYQEVTKISQRIISIQPGYGSEIYVMTCLSWAKSKNYTKALEVIELGTVYFPKNAQIFYYRGKILFHLKKYNDAESSFNQSYEICYLPQTLICLADCYKKSNQKEKQLATLNKLLSQKNFDKQNSFNSQNIFVRKLKVLFQLSKYEEIINEVQINQKYVNLFQNTQLKAEVQYIHAFSLFKKGDNAKSFEKFQDCIVNQYFYVKSLKMLIVLQILQKNFYQATHLCSQLQKQNFNTQNDQIFNLLTTFVEGAINLVRRNFKQGIQILSKVQLSLSNKEFKKYNNLSLSSQYELCQNFQCFKTVKQLQHLFMSYGLFCIGEFNFCQSAILKQRETCNNLKYTKGLQYNYKLCQAIISFQQKSYSSALLYLQQADQIFNSRLQVFFYRSVVLIQIFIQTLENSESQQKFTENEETQMIKAIKINFQEALKRISSTANNSKATVFYYQTLFHCYLKEWKQALSSIQQCIAKSDDNYWRYYYTKAMIFACIHNFDDATTELSIAINLSEGQRAQCFLLRSKCLQIEGKGNDAFYDLQQYIALKPKDQDVHMYAGQLLFQNGAFQDAMVAFEHKEIQKTPQNYDIFLTLAKTFFLTGRFFESQEKMFTAFNLNPTDKQIQFDSKTIKYTADLIKQINSGRIKDNIIIFNQQLSNLFDLKNKNKKFGKIFRQMDIYLFRSLIYLYSGDHTDAIQNFQKLLIEKRKSIIFQNSSEDKQIDLMKDTEEDQFDKISNQLKIFTNQIKYNIVICYLLGGDIENCKKILNQMKVDQKQTFYSQFTKFKNGILAQSFIFQKEEIFPNKNKLSQFLPPLSINIKQRKLNIKLKLCIPFPKVEPPEIFPTFDTSLLKSLTIYGIQGKPEAPWIVKQDNVIKFTEKMEYISRLDFNDSEAVSSATAIIDLGQSSVISRNNFTKKQKSQRSSLFSKRTLKKKNSINLNF